MKIFAKALAVATSSAALLALTAVPTFASGISVVISGNGAGSHNSANVSVGSSFNNCHRHNRTTQHNSAHISNNIWVWSNTGGNEANKNTGGDVTISTGDSEVSIEISNNVNSNLIH